MKKLKIFKWFLVGGGSKLYFIDFVFPKPFDEEALWYGGKANRWPANTVVVLSEDSKLPATSVIGSGAPLKLVSNDFKEFFLGEVNATHIQFLPLQEIATPSRSIVLKNYWVLNIIKCVDCVDWTKIRNSPDKEHPGERYLNEPGPFTIFANKVPQDVKLFKPVGDSYSMLLTGELLQKLKKQFPNHASTFREQIMAEDK